MMVRYDLKMGCDNFQGLLFIVDGEIDEKHALQFTKIIVSQGITLLLDISRK